KTASNTNERTCISALLPPGSAGSEKLTALVFDHVQASSALSVLNSLCFDFALRLRSAGTDVSLTYIRPVCVPPREAVARLPTLATHTAWGTPQGHISDDASAWPSLWDINHSVAVAYGLDASDFRHILSSFPVFKRKRPAFFAFLENRLAAWQSSA